MLHRILARKTETQITDSNIYQYIIKKPGILMTARVSKMKERQTPEDTKEMEG